MKLSKSIKPISYVKSNTAKIICEIAETREPIYITQNGEAKAVLQDIDSYERLQESLAMLKIVAMGEKEYQAGDYQSAKEVFAEFDEYFRAK